MGGHMGKCVVCGKETCKVLFSRAIVKPYICSTKCLKEYFSVLKKLESNKKKYPVNQYKGKAP